MDKQKKYNILSVTEQEVAQSKDSEILCGAS